MDYQRIYGEFIADRLTKQPSKPTYFEKHHIVPRSLGGGDDASNLIRLTARDHYFAHCCLAKIHGGKMWSALFSMANMTKVCGSAAYFLKGRVVEMARREAAKVRSENMTELWATGEFTRDRVYLPKTAAQRAHMSEVMRGRKNSQDSLNKAKATRQSNASKHVFMHSRTGESFSGTSLEFQNKAKVSQAMASLLCAGKIKSASEWCLQGTNIKSLRGRDPVVRVFRHADGETFVGTTWEFKTKFNLDSGVISNLVNGKNRVQSFKGWRHAAQEIRQG